ncbi:hypothetical protein ACJZ2D_013501 [Fusarium nematophilum]
MPQPESTAVEELTVGYLEEVILRLTRPEHRGLFRVALELIDRIGSRPARESDPSPDDHPAGSQASTATTPSPASEDGLHDPEVQNQESRSSASIRKSGNDGKPGIAGGDLTRLDSAASGARPNDQDAEQEGQRQPGDIIVEMYEELERLSKRSTPPYSRLFREIIMAGYSFEEGAEIEEECPEEAPEAADEHAELLEGHRSRFARFLEQVTEASWQLIESQSAVADRSLLLEGKRRRKRRRVD